MRKLVSMVLILALCLGWGTALAGEAQNANLFLHTAPDYSEDSLTEKWIAGATCVGDTLYVLTANTLEKWVPGMVVPELVWEDLTAFPLEGSGAVEDTPAPTLSALFSDGERLLALDTESGLLWTLADGEELLQPSLRTSLDWSEMLYETEDEYAFFNISIVNLAARDGVLWLLGFDYEKDPLNPILFRWDMETGKALESIEGKHIQALTPYRDGQFLCVLKAFGLAGEESDGEEGGEEGAVQLGIFDPQAGSVTALVGLGDVQPVGLAYDAQSNTAYYLSNETLMSLPELSAPAVASAYFPMPDPDSVGCGFLAGGMYYATDFNGVLVRKIDPASAEGGALTIYGARDNRPMLALAQESPDTHARNASAFYNTEEELIAALQSGTDAPDVLILDSNDISISRLIDEGCALDLSVNAEALALVQDMAPVYSGPVLQGDKLYALPLAMDGALMGYNSGIWASLGLSEEDLPKTYGELLDFAANWQNAYAKEHPEIRLFDQVYAKESLLSILLDHYFAYCKSGNLPLDFESGLFLGLMQKLESLPADAPLQESDDEPEEYWDDAVFTTYFAFGQFYTEDRFAPLPLAMETGGEPVVPVNVRMAIVNPHTTHAQEAMLYLGMLMRYYDQTGAYITLFPGHNEPVLYPFFSEQVEEREAELTATKAQLEGASPEDAADLEMEIEFLEDFVAHPEDYITRELVSKAQIESFRSRVEPYLYEVGPNPLYKEAGEAADAYTLSQEYLEGVTNLQQFLQTLAQRAQGVMPEAE